MAIDRIEINSMLVVACFVSVLLLSSQSAASYSTYLLAVVMLVTHRRWNDVFLDWYTWLVLGLVSYLALTTLWSSPFEMYSIFSYAGKAALVFLFVVAFGECQLRGQLQSWLGRALAVSGTLACSLAILVFFISNPEDNRLNGLGQLDTHVIAALIFSVTMIFLMDALNKEKSLIWRVTLGFAICTIVVAVALSQSRNAWVSLVIGAGVFVLAHRTRRSQEFLISVVVLSLLIGVVLVTLFLNESSRELVLPRGDSYRIVVWQMLLQQVLDTNILFGVGIGSSDNVFAEGFEFFHAHNMYLSVFFQGGLLALGLFLLLIGATVQTLLANYSSSDAKLALAILAIALSSYLLDGHELLDKVGETWFLFWLPVAIALGLRWGRALREV